jgi:ferrous iron transport protein B
MGLGCNAVGVTGCRIIESRRERLVAILTNNLVPCNGRFPLMIAVISMFFAPTGASGSVLRAGILAGVIALGVGLTFFASRLLSGTLLRGGAAPFILELPPYRAPRVLQVLARSLLDRTLLVLGRAAVIAAPAGLVIWILANVSVGDVTLFTRATDFFEPFARLLGLDGVILLAFILAFPANEVVLPVLVMGYLGSGALTETATLAQLHAILAAHGWSAVTAVCVVLFSLAHWPCSTTCLTVRRETGSLRWTVAAFLLPTVLGLALCALVNFAAKLF